MARAKICGNCINESACKEARCYCSAINELFRIYEDSKKMIAKEFINEHRSMLSIVDAEQSEEYRNIADQVISSLTELSFIRDYDIKVGYVKSYEEKTSKGMIVYADCRKVNDVYQCFIPYDFVITVYEPNVILFTPNQIKALIWHELRHIGLNDRTLKTEYKIMPHEIEDFHSIIDRLGTRWGEPDMDIEDITASEV